MNLRKFILILTITFISLSSPEEEGQLLVEKITFDKLFHLASTNNTDNCVILYYSPNCPHCIKFKPIYYEYVFENQLTDFKFMEVNCAEDQKSCNFMKINAYPILSIYKGNLMYRFEKRPSKEEIHLFLTENYKDQKSFVIPRTLPTTMENVYDVYHDFKEEVYYTFYHSVSIFMKTLLIIMFVMCFLLLLSILYLMYLCCDEFICGRNKKYKEDW